MLISGVSAWKASANGFRLPDQDAFATARGEAFVATADNPSAIYYNPAGITQLPDNNLRGGVYGIYLDSSYSPPESGQTYHSSQNFAAVPQFFYTYTAKDAPLPRKLQTERQRLTRTAEGLPVRVSFCVQRGRRLLPQHTKNARALRRLCICMPACGGGGSNPPRLLLVLSKKLLNPVVKSQLTLAESIMGKASMVATKHGFQATCPWNVRPFFLFLRGWSSTCVFQSRICLKMFRSYLSWCFLFLFDSYSIACASRTC